MLDTETPEYRVEMTRTVTDTTRCWSAQNRESFRELVERLGSCATTLSLRASGGEAVRSAHGTFHLSYRADRANRTLTVTYVRPCAHQSSCLNR
jgi:hypothetical protein